MLSTLVTWLQEVPKAYTICVDLDSGHPHGHPCYGQLTAVKKVSADQCHLTVSWAQVFNSLRGRRFFFKLSTDQLLF